MSRDQFWEGVAARIDGVPDFDNPYPRDSPSALEWALGWHEEFIHRLFYSADEPS